MVRATGEIRGDDGFVGLGRAIVAVAGDRHRSDKEERNMNGTQLGQENRLLTGIRDQKGSREVEELDSVESIVWRKPPGCDNS